MPGTTAFFLAPQVAKGTTSVPNFTGGNATVIFNRLRESGDANDGANVDSGIDIDPTKNQLFGFIEDQVGGGSLPASITGAQVVAQIGGNQAFGVDFGSGLYNVTTFAYIEKASVIGGTLPAGGGNSGMAITVSATVAVTYIMQMAYTGRIFTRWLGNGSGADALAFVLEL